MTKKKKVIQMAILAVISAAVFSAFLLLVYRPDNLYTGLGGIGAAAVAAAAAFVYALMSDSFIRGLYHAAAIFTAPLSVYCLAAYPQLLFQRIVQFGLLFFSLIIIVDSLLVFVRKKLGERHAELFSGVYLSDSVAGVLSKYVSAGIILLFVYTAFSCLLGMDPELSSGIGFVGIAYKFILN